MVNEEEAVKDSLKILGLSKYQQSVFFFVLEFQNGGVTASTVGYEIEIPRQTANSILKKLVSLGLVARRKEKGVYMFSSDRRQIRDYAYARSRAIQEAAQNLIRIVKLR